MNIPKLKQQKTIKTCHKISWEDNYAWIHQENILEVLKNPTKLNPEVRKYLEKNNEYLISKWCVIDLCNEEKQNTLYFTSLSCDQIFYRHYFKIYYPG